MEKIRRLAEAEKLIMQFIWAAGRPVTTKEILANLPEGKEWKQSTVITFLSRLIEKGVLKANRISKAHHYEPCLTEQEYQNFETRQFVAEVHKGSILGFFSTLCDNGDLTKEDIEELMKSLKDG